MPSHVAKLMRCGASADNRPIIEMHIARQLDGIGAYDMIAENATMGGVAIRHEKTIRTYYRFFAVFGAKMNRGKFAYDSAVSDLDE